MKFSAAAVLVLAAFLGRAVASGPIAVYALVDKVVFEPNADKPERIRVSGVFIPAVQRPNNSTDYSAPERGFLYFSLPSAETELALREWSDLKSVAGTRQVVGFGAAWAGTVTVRKPGGGEKAPDIFIMGNGLVKINADQPRAKALLDAAR